MQRQGQAIVTKSTFENIDITLIVRKIYSAIVSAIEDVPVLEVDLLPLGNT